MAFHFPPSELWEMDCEELLFWVDGIDWINKESKNASIEAEKEAAAINGLGDF